MNTAQPPHDHIPLKNKLGYACGAMADNLIMNVFSSLVLPVYNIGLFISPVMLGWAMAIPRALDAVIDPMMGNISDNTRSRWGRRRPYILGGAIACALILPLLWMSPVKTDWGVFWWLTIFGLLYFLAYTVFIIPYQALGFEMTTDYDERTRLLAWPNYVGMTTSFLLPWLPRLIAYSGFGGLVPGAIYVSIGVGVIVLFGGIMPVIFGREIARAEGQETTTFLHALKEAASNRAFLVVALSNVIVLTGLATFVNLSLYVNIFLIYGGNRDAGLALCGVAGSVYAGVSYVSVIVAVWMSTRIGKKAAAQILLVLTLVGVGSQWFTLRPDMPYLQLVSTVIIGLGLQGTWMTFFTMVGDVCEEDELQTGLRREGIFSSVGAFSRKMAVAAASILGGGALSWVGFNAETAATTGMPESVGLALKVAFVFGQAVVVLLGLIAISFYPITRKRALETQRIMAARRAEARE
ncbi:MAG: MFS transporter [Verrucomicrobiaceae bacterium]|nr:MAG: MFS transporter [Verrucomicrobiaceae bacterium]